MSNMSYCRFRNTLLDLQDCQENLFDEYGNTPSDLSKDEERARKQLIELCKEIAQDIENNGDEKDDDSRDVHGDRNLESEAS
jgi:hypothetical protein